MTICGTVVNFGHTWIQIRIGDGHSYAKVQGYRMKNVASGRAFLVKH